VDTPTAYAWPEAWSGSAVPPYVGDKPWGWEPPGWSLTSAGTFEDDPGNTDTYDDPGGTYVAWWDANGSRQRRPFTTDQMGTVRGSPPGELAYWTRRLGSDAVDLHTGRDRGAVWAVETRAEPGFGRGIQMMRSPDGALIAWAEYPVWWCGGPRHPEVVSDRFTRHPGPKRMAVACGCRTTLSTRTDTARLRYRTTAA
jgi:hypothetical protein